MNNIVNRFCEFWTNRTMRNSKRLLVKALKLADEIELTGDLETAKKLRDQARPIIDAHRAHAVDQGKAREQIIEDRKKST